MSVSASYLDVDLVSDGAPPECASSDLGCHETPSFTPASSSFHGSILSRSVTGSVSSLSGSTSSQPLPSSDFSVLPANVEALANHLYALARASDKKAVFVERIAELVRKGDLRVSSSFREPHDASRSIFGAPEPSPRVESTSSLLFERGSMFKFLPSTSDSITLLSSEATHLECVSSTLFVLNGRTHLSTSGGSVRIASSQPTSMQHSLTVSGGAHLALLSLSVDDKYAAAAAPASKHLVSIALPLAGPRLDLSSFSASALTVTPAFTGALASAPLHFLSSSPVVFRLQLRRSFGKSSPDSTAMSTDLAADQSQGSQSGSPSSFGGSQPQPVEVSDSTTPTVIQLHPSRQQVVDISSNIEGVAALRVIDAATVLLFIIPGAHHYPGPHIRISLLITPTADKAEEPRASRANGGARKRATKRSMAAESTNSSYAALSTAQRLQQAVLQGDDALANALLLSAPSPTELVHARTSFGETLLHLAVSVGNEHLAGLCLAQGADISARDYDGLTALQWSEKQSNVTAKSMLRLMHNRAASSALYKRTEFPSTNGKLTLSDGTILDGDSTFILPSSAVKEAQPLKSTKSVCEAAPRVALSVIPSAEENKRKAPSIALSPVLPTKRATVFNTTATAANITAQAARRSNRGTKRSLTRTVRNEAPEEAAVESNTPAQVDWLSLPPHLLVYIISLVRYEDRPSVLLSCHTLYHLANPWRVKELRTRPEPIQSPEISIKMREILIEWLVEVQQEYKLHRNTLFLAVSYIDRVLGAGPLPKQELQLLGATCMWIAAKFEELTSPLLRDFEYICDATYKARQFTEMESRVLHRLNFEASSVTVVHFVTEYLADIGIVREDLVSLAYFFAELSLSDHTLAATVPSCVATAIFVLVTAHFLPHAEGLQCQSRLRVASGYSLYDPEVRRCMGRLVLFFTPPNSRRAQAIFDKYNKEANHSVVRQAQAVKWTV